MMCIETTGTRNSGGYGQVSVLVGPDKRYNILATRLLFEQTWGSKLRPGQVVRHSCDNPPCVNPLHLMVGTQRDNARDRVDRGRHQGALQTHCKNGHEFTEENIYRRGVNGQQRQCKACTKKRELRRRPRRRDRGRPRVQ